MRLKHLWFVTVWLKEILWKLQVNEQKVMKVMYYAIIVQHGIFCFKYSNVSWTLMTIILLFYLHPHSRMHLFDQKQIKNSNFLKY